MKVHDDISLEQKLKKKVKIVLQVMTVPLYASYVIFLMLLPSGLKIIPQVTYSLFSLLCKDKVVLF